MKPSKYIYIAPHIVGSLKNLGYCYDTDREEKDSREEAQRYGEEQLEHDDFWVAEIRNGKVVALYSGEEKRDDPQEVKDVNKELFS